MNELAVNSRSSCEERRALLPNANATDSDKKPTLKTISKLSGLAVPTVSRALNDAPDIGRHTKELVRKIAAEIGYVPNRAGVRLRTGRTNVISLVMSTEHDMMNHTARLISSVAAGLRNTPYHLIVTPFFPDEDPMKPIRYIVETGSADAIIINQIEPEDPRVAYLMERKFPFATHGRTKWADKHPYYDFDNGAFGRIETQRLHARNRKHIALLAPPMQHSYAQEMFKGVTEAAEQMGIRVSLMQTVTSDSIGEEVRTAVQAMISTDPTIDAFIAGSTSSAMAIVAAIEGLGLKVGDQIDVSAKEAIPFLQSYRSEILTMAEKVGVAGEFLAEAAIRAIRDPDNPMQELEVPE